MKIHIFARKTRATRNARPPKTRKKHTCQNDAENKTQARKNKNKHELSEAEQTKKTFWKPCVFKENTHFCEKNEGGQEIEGDQERPAAQHTTHTWTQNQKKMKQIERGM